MSLRKIDPHKIEVDLAARNFLNGVPFELAARGLDAEEVRARAMDIKEEIHHEPTRIMPKSTTAHIRALAGGGASANAAIQKENRPERRRPNT